MDAGMSMRTIAFDTETWPISPGRLAPELVCLTWAWGHDKGILLRADALAWFGAVLRDHDTVLVGHNVAYDLAVLCAADPALMPHVWAAYEQDRIRDTNIHRMLTRIADGSFQDKPPPTFSLAELVMENFGVDLSADKKDPASWRMRYAELDGVPLAQWPEQAVSYAVDDAVWTFRLHERQQAEPVEDWFPQCRAAWVLHLAGCWGMRTDGVAVDALEAKIRARVAKATPDLIAAGLLIPQKDGTTKKSTKEFQRRVVACLGENAPTTAKGNVQYGEETLYLTDDPALLLYASVSKDVGELARNIPALKRGATVPINPRFHVLVASGRTSVSAGDGDGEETGAQVQNLPRRKGVRECFVPRDGYAFVNTDIGSAELVGLAQICLDLFGWSNLAEVLRAGRDPHKVTAAQMTGIDYDAFVVLHLSGDVQAVEARQLSKIANFGFPGGLSPATMVMWARNQTRKEDGTYPDWILRFDEEKATWLREVWLSAYPEMKLLFAEARRVVKAGGGLAFKVQHRSNRVRGGLRYCDWLNTNFQGIVADAAKLWMWNVQRECWNVPSSPLYGARVVNMIHDELMTESRIERVHEVATRQAELGIEAMHTFCPDVPAKVEGAAALRWYKGADPVHVDGRLVPGKPVVEGGKTRWVPA